LTGGRLGWCFLLGALRLATTDSACEGMREAPFLLVSCLQVKDKQLAELRKQLEAAKAALAESNEELAATKEELAATKEELVATKEEVRGRLRATCCTRLACLCQRACLAGARASCVGCKPRLAQ
jgi:hypothetical protein